MKSRCQVVCADPLSITFDVKGVSGPDLASEFSERGNNGRIVPESE
jgi:hypothetical protein